MKSAAIYARVSTEEQVKNTSLKGQLDACREHAARQGYTVIKELAEDFSGARLDRPGLSELREMARIGEIHALVVYEADRLSRKLGHLLLLQEEFDRLGTELLFVNSQDDTTSPEGRMFFQMRGAFSEYEKSKITERLRLGKLRLAKGGKIIGNRCQPLGYALVNGQYQIIEEEARIVRQIFEWMAHDKMTLRQIGIKLTQVGVTTKQGNPRWLPNSVKAILDNMTYAGTFHWNKTKPVLPRSRRSEGPHKVEKTSKQRRDPSEWVAVPCPAIVSRELYEAAQKQLQTNRARSSRNTRHSYLLRGMVKCALCGYRYCGRASSPRRRYYYCGGKQNGEIYRARYTGQLCSSHYLPADQLEARIWDYIKEQVTNEEALVAAFEHRGQLAAEELRRNQEELETQYAVEEKLKRKENEMLDLYSEGIISREVLRERLADIHKKQESALETKQEIKARMDRRETATASPEALREYCRLAKVGVAHADANSNEDGREYRREFLEMLETSIVIDEEWIHISGIITGRLPLIETLDGPDACLLSTTDGRGMRCHGPAPRGGGRGPGRRFRGRSRPGRPAVPARHTRRRDPGRRHPHRPPRP